MIEIDEIDKIVNEVLNETIKIANRKISKAFRLCVNRYYMDYSPHYYSRKYLLYNVFSINYKKIGDLKYEIIMRLNPEMMQKYRKKYPNLEPIDGLYNDVFHLGKHGRTEYCSFRTVKYNNKTKKLEKVKSYKKDAYTTVPIPMTNPPPFNLFLTKINEIEESIPEIFNKNFHKKITQLKTNI